MRTGRALLSTATAAFGGAAMLDYAERVGEGRAPGNHAVVLGLLSARLGVPRLEAVVGELYAFSASWVAAAVRLAVTDHRTAQGAAASRALGDRRGGAERSRPGRPAHLQLHTPAGRDGDASRAGRSSSVRDLRKGASCPRNANTLTSTGTPTTTAPWDSTSTRYAVGVVVIVVQQMSGVSVFEATRRSPITSRHGYLSGGGTR